MTGPYILFSVFVDTGPPYFAPQSQCRSNNSNMSLVCNSKYLLSQTLGNNYASSTQNHVADDTQFFSHSNIFNTFFVVPDTFTNASPYFTQFSNTVGMFLYFSCCPGFWGGCLGYKPYIFFCNVSRFLLFLTVATAQSRQGICYVLATRLVSNSVNKNLYTQYPAFNAAGGSLLLRVQTFQWLVISYKMKLDPIQVSVKTFTNPYDC